MIQQRRVRKKDRHHSPERESSPADRGLKTEHRKERVLISGKGVGESSDRPGHRKDKMVHRRRKKADFNLGLLRKRESIRQEESFEVASPSLEDLSESEKEDIKKRMRMKKRYTGKMGYRDTSHAKSQRRRGKLGWFMTAVSNEDNGALGEVKRAACPIGRRWRCGRT